MDGFAKISKAANWYGMKKKALWKRSHCLCRWQILLFKEGDGRVILIEATPKGWTPKGEFTISPQTKQRNPKGKLDPSGHFKWENVLKRSGIDLLLRHQGLNHSALLQTKNFFSFFGNHLGVPRRVPNDIHACLGHSIEVGNPCLGVIRYHGTHAATLRSKGHLDEDFATSSSPSTRRS